MPATVSTKGFAEADKKLGQLPIELRGKALTSALRTAGRLVVREAQTIVPISDDDDAKHLRDTLAVSVKEARVGMIAIIGAARPAGAHAHLVEGAGGDDNHNIDVRHHSHGKPTGTILRKQPFIGPASQGTLEEQNRVITASLQRTIDRVMG